MLKDILFGRTAVPWLAKGMDAMANRQKAVADNIANAQSPGYKRKVVAFEEKLQNVLKSQERERLVRTDPRHLKPQIPWSRLNPVFRDADERKDGPGAEEVAVEREMSDLAQTQLKFEAEVKLTHTQLEMLKMAIRGTR